MYQILHSFDIELINIRLYILYYDPVRRCPRITHRISWGQGGWSNEGTLIEPQAE
jgi:hypothetical protein